MYIRLAGNGNDAANNKTRICVGETLFYISIKLDENETFNDDARFQALRVFGEYLIV